MPLAISLPGELMLITDESGLYDGMGAHLPHGIIRHKSEYVRGTTHTQGIESFWSILKRGLTGTYYHVDEGYLNQWELYTKLAKPPALVRRPPLL